MDPLLQKLTLAVPIYNEAAYLRETLKSCLGQAGTIVLHDNASTDESSRICAEFAAAHPNVVHVCRPENIGAFANFKAPLFECATEYFCWIGGHDQIAPDYALHLVRRLEQSADLALAAGTIQHIDEKGNELKRRTRSVFLDPAVQPNPLDRLEALTRHLRDCFIFHGVFRTEVLRQAWFDTPCLGFDRVMLFRVAALGRLAYVPDALLYARDFPKTRDAKKDRERRAEIVGKQRLQKTNFTQNKHLILTCIEQATDDKSLTHALDVVERIRRRHHQRRKYQRRRLVLGIGGLLAFAALVYFIIQRT